MNLGYCCINELLKKKGITTNRGANFKTIEKLGIEICYERGEKNVIDLFEILKWNEEHGIKCFRVSSDIFPHISNPMVLYKYPFYKLDFTADLLKTIGNFAKEKGMRLTAHPSHFIQLGTPNSDVLEKSVYDLACHALLFDTMGLGIVDGTCCVIHVGGIFSDKQETLKRWEQNYNNLNPSIKKFIVLENDERYTIEEILPMCEKNSIPIVVDFFHHEINGKDLFNIFDEKLLERIWNIWKKRGFPRPKTHLSTQEPGKRIGAHSFTIKPTDINPKVLYYCNKYGVDLMLETKSKEANVLSLHKQFFDKHEKSGKISWTLRKEWTKLKKYES